MKTLFLFIQSSCIEDTFFFELDGDYSHLYSTYINECDNKDNIDELSSLVYDEKGKIKVHKLQFPTKDYNFFVKCGFLD